LLRDLADESIRLPRKRLNQRRSAHAQRILCKADGAWEGALGHDRVRPKRFEQLPLGNDPFVVLDEIQQEIEHLRLQLACLAGHPQLAAGRIDLEFSENECHVGRFAKLSVC